MRPNNWYYRIALSVLGIIALSSCSIFEPTPVEISYGVYQGEHSVTFKDSADIKRYGGILFSHSMRMVFKKETLYNFDSTTTAGATVIPVSNGYYTLRYRKITFNDTTPSSNGIQGHPLLLKGEWEYTFDGRNLVFFSETDRWKRTIFLTLL